jgi:hypothetical protein
MRIVGIPTGKITGGSSRIRFWGFLNALPKGTTWQHYEKELDGDIFYVQKKSSDRVLELAAQARATGMSVVYDCDDGDGDRKKKDRDDPAMFNLAHAITTDTEERATEFRKRTRKPVYVVPDCIDYGIKENEAVGVKKQVETIVTFGTHKVLEACWDKLKHIPVFYHRVYITDRRIPIFKNWVYKAWSLDNFVCRLKEAELCVLCHPTNRTGRMKSNNRLLVTMALGLPTLVSDTRAYRETVDQLELPDMLIDDKINLCVADILPPEKRLQISEKCHQWVWECYAPEKSGAILEQVFRKVLRDTSLSSRP